MRTRRRTAPSCAARSAGTSSDRPSPIGRASASRPHRGRDHPSSRARWLPDSESTRVGRTGPRHPRASMTERPGQATSPVVAALVCLPGLHAQRATKRAPEHTPYTPPPRQPPPIPLASAPTSGRIPGKAGKHGGCPQRGVDPVGPLTVAMRGRNGRLVRLFDRSKNRRIRFCSPLEADLFPRTAC